MYYYLKRIKQGIFCIMNIIPFVIFSLKWDKYHKEQAEAEGLTWEEYERKYFTIDNHDGEASRIYRNPWDNQ